MRKVFVSIIVAIVAAGSAYAAPINLQNAGFETPAYSGAAWYHQGSGAGVISGWINANSADLYIVNALDAPQGSQYLYGLTGSRWLYQDIIEAVLPNTTYTLSCKMSGFESTSFMLGLQGGDGNSANGGFMEYKGNTVTDRLWHDYAMSYTTGATVTPDSTLRIMVSYEANAWGNNVACELDDFQLSATTVPEPASLAALGSLLICAAGFIRRKR